MRWTTLTAILTGTVAACGYCAERRAQEIMNVQPGYYLEPRYRVSLVAPALNEEKYVDRLLCSALNQTEPLAEMIIVDSSDNDLTRQTALSLGARVVSYPRGNVAAARNCGADNTSGEIIVFCDADVMLDHQFVEKALDALEEGYLAVHPREVFYDSRLHNITVSPLQFFRSPNMTTRCVAVWRQVFNEIGGYDASCNPLEHCREDLTLGERINDLHGPGNIKVLGPLIATSARRYKKQGSQSWNQGLWGEPVRSYQELTE